MNIFLLKKANFTFQVVALKTNAFSSPTSENEPQFFGQTPFSPPSSQSLPSISRTHLSQPPGILIGMLNIGGCLLNIEESCTWPFVILPIQL